MATQPKAPKYQNKFAFAHNPNSKKSQIIAGIPNVGLCHRCHDIIEWRKKFRKYKPIKNLAKCACCGEKKIRSAYHLWCTDCAKGANACPKCLQNRDIVEAEEAALTQEQIQEMIVQVGMKERVRRRIWRLWENNKVTDAELKQMILNYNPDSKDEPTREDEEADAEEENARAAKLAASRGPPPKPKQATAAAAAPAAAAAAQPAAASSSAAAPASAAKDDDDDDEDNDEDDDDDYNDASSGDDEEEAEFQRAQAAAAAAKRGPPPKPKAAAPAAAAASAAPIEQALASASISDANAAT